MRKSYDISEKMIVLSQSIEEAPTHPPPLTDSNKKLVNEEEMHFTELNSSADTSMRASTSTSTAVTSTSGTASISADTSTGDSASVSKSLFSVGVPSSTKPSQPIFSYAKPSTSAGNNLMIVGEFSKQKRT